MSTPKEAPAAPEPMANPPIDVPPELAAKGVYLIDASVDDMPPLEEEDVALPFDMPPADDQVAPAAAGVLVADTLPALLAPLETGSIEPPAGEVVVYHAAETLNQQMLALPVPTSDEECQRASDFLTVSAQLKAAIRAEWEPVRKATYDAWKAVCEQIAKRAGLLEREGEVSIRAGVGSYMQVKRVTAENAARAELEAQRVARQAAADAEHKALLEAGKTAQAELVLTHAQSAPLVQPTPVKTSVPGFSGRTAYEVTIDDPAVVPREYCTPDLKLLQAAADANKGKVKIPGVTVTVKTIPARRGRLL